jgi:hypothetical protein
MFMQDLTDALAETGATIAFDATGEKYLINPSKGVGQTTAL